MEAATIRTVSSLRHVALRIGARMRFLRKEGGRCPVRPLAQSGLRVTTSWCAAVVRIRAERPKLCNWVDTADHRKGTGLVFAIEGRWFRRVELARRKSGGVLRIVEPETYIESVSRGQACVRVEAEDLVKEDRLNTDVAIVGVLSDFNVGLIPSQTEAAVELWILAAIGKERAVLNGEQIECEARLDAVEIEDQRVIQLAADHRSLGAWLLIGIGSQAVDNRWIGDEVKGNFILLVLRHGDA
jgi:hypothetical protein